MRLQPELPGLVDDAHAAAAQLAQNLVARDPRQAGADRWLVARDVRLRQARGPVSQVPRLQGLLGAFLSIRPGVA